MKIYIFLFFLIIITSKCFSQDRIIARYAGGEISETEFKNRYELSPQVVDPLFGADSAKQQLLASMIAEKLWAKEAELSGFVSNPDLQGYLGVLRKMFIRDQLFKKVIEPKITISGTDIQHAQEMNKYILSLLILSNNDSSVIAGMYNELNNNKISFDSLLLQQTSPGAKDVYVIHYGDMTKEWIENILFELKVNQYTAPIRDGNLWLIFKLVRKDDNPGEPKDPLKTYKYRLKERRVREAGELYLSNLLKNVKINFNEKNVQLLSERLLLQIKSVNKISGNDTVLYLNEKNIYTLRDEMSTEFLHQEIIRFPGKSVTVSEILDYFAFHGFSIRSSNLKYIKGKLVKDLQQITEEEYLYREGLHTIPNAETAAELELSVWKENALGQLIRNRYIDSANVSENQVNDYYSKMNSSGEAIGKIQLSIAAHNDLDTMSKIMDLLNSGADFDKLAMLYKQNKYAANSPMPYSHFAPFDDKLRLYKYGDIIGPIKVDSTYYLMKVMKVKEADSLFIKPFEAVKKDLQLMLKIKAVEKLMNKKTAELAVKFGLDINSNVMKDVKVIDIPTFVYRFIGFGGRIAAVPFTTPMYMWMKEYQSKKKQMP